MAVGMLGDNVKIQKIYNLHQIINKYMNKVPIFCAKFLFFSCFLPSQIPICLFFLTIPIT